MDVARMLAGRSRQEYAIHSKKAASPRIKNGVNETKKRLPNEEIPAQSSVTTDSVKVGRECHYRIKTQQFVASSQEK